PNNVWRAHSDTDPVILCDVNAALHAPLSDHLPIITIVELPITWTSSPPSPDFQDVDWEKFDASLSLVLDLCSPAQAITNKADFDSKVDLLTVIIQETISTHILMKKPTPFSKCGWCSKLKELKIKKNKLSYEAYKFQDIQDHPAKQEHAAACHESTKAIKNKCVEHWISPIVSLHRPVSVAYLNSAQSVFLIVKSFVMFISLPPILFRKFCLAA
ncbi:hypothetical protein L208DRAFT_1249487, partial [Tricholoma matsutake]